MSIVIGCLGVVAVRVWATVGQVLIARFNDYVLGKSGQITSRIIPSFFLSLSLSLLPLPSLPFSLSPLSLPLPLPLQWFIQSTCATQGTGLYEGLDWLSAELSKTG